MGDDPESDSGIHIGMEMKHHLVLAGGAEWPFGQANLPTLQSYPHRLYRNDDILGSHGAKQSPLVTSLTGYRHGQAIELLATGFSCDHVLHGRSLQFSPPRFECLQVSCGRRYRKTKWDQVVTSVTGTYRDLFSQISKMPDLFQQDNIHLSTPITISATRDTLSSTLEFTSRIQVTD